MGLPKMRFCNGRATMLLETNSKNSLKNKLSLLERMVVLKSSAWSSSVLERYFVAFFDTVNNTSKGVNIYQKSTWALSLPLTLHFMAATDLPVLKIMYRAVYLNKSPQKGQLSHHDRRYLHHCPDLLAWLSRGAERGVFGLRSEGPQSCIRPESCTVDTLSPFSTTSERCPTEKAIDGLEMKIKVVHRKSRKRNNDENITKNVPFFR